MNTEESLWISSYIFYDPQKIDFLLLKGVYPFVMDLNNNFFFIRYRANGSHIRLRIKAKNHDDKITIKRNLTSYFDGWFKKFPSEREEPEYVKAGKYYWYPNNSIHYVEYVPEIDRYGGNLGIHIAEEHFEFSSKTVLELLDQTADLNYNKKLAFSLILNSFFAVGLGFSRNEAAMFFRILFNVWLPLSFRTKDALKLDEKSDKKFREETLALFKAKFESQKSLIIPKIKDAWFYSNNSAEISNSLIKKWIHNTKIVKKKYNKLYINNKVKIPKLYKYTSKLFDKKELEHYTIDLWLIYQSFVHMTNNRLGLTTRDEPYINFVLYKSIELL